MTGSIRVGTRTDCKEAQGSFPGENVLFLEVELGYTVVCSCQNSPNCTLDLYISLHVNYKKGKEEGESEGEEEEENSK